MYLFYYFRYRSTSDVSFTDSYNIIPMALALRAQIQNHTGKWPHLVLSNVHQSKVSVELNIAISTLLHHESVEIYETYHGFLTLAMEQVKYNGLILVPAITYRYENETPDHKKTVLLYGLSTEQLNSKNFSSPYITIQHYAKVKNIPLSEIIIGKYSLGAHLEKAFIHAIPSDSIDLAMGIGQYAKGYKYKYRFNLIYSYTINYNISAIKAYIPLFYTTSLMRNHYADLFARALKEFLNQEYKSEAMAFSTDTSDFNTSEITAAVTDPTAEASTSVTLNIVNSLLVISIYVTSF